MIFFCLLKRLHERVDCLVDRAHHKAQSNPGASYFLKADDTAKDSA